MLGFTAGPVSLACWGRTCRRLILESFSGFIRSKDAEKIGDAKKFEGKMVTVSGKSEPYNEKPQIVITSPDQIKVIEQSAPAGAAKP